MGTEGKKKVQEFRSYKDLTIYGKKYTTTNVNKKLDVGN